MNKLSPSLDCKALGALSEPRQKLPELAEGEGVRVSRVHPDPERSVPADSVRTLQQYLNFPRRNFLIYLCSRLTLPGHSRARLGESEDVYAGRDLFDEEQEDLVRHVQDVTRRGGGG